MSSRLKQTDENGHCRDEQHGTCVRRERRGREGRGGGGEGGKEKGEGEGGRERRGERGGRREEVREMNDVK